MPSDHRGIHWALGAALCGGMFLLPWKLANAGGDAGSSTFVLLAFAAVFNTTLALAGQRRQRSESPGRITRYEWGVSVVLGALSLVGNLCSALAIESLSASVLTILLRTDVLVVAILAWLILRERVDQRFVVGTIIAAVGVVVLHDPRGDAQVDVRGTLFAMGAVFFFASMAVLTRKAIHRIDPVRVNALRLWISLPLWILLAGGFGNLGSMAAPRLGWLALAAFLGPFLARLCMMQSSRYIDARVTSLVGLGSPLVTMPLEVLLLGHVPAANELLGGAILLSGIAVPLLQRGSTTVSNARGLGEGRRNGRSREHPG